MLSVKNGWRVVKKPAGGAYFGPITAELRWAASTGSGAAVQPATPCRMPERAMPPRRCAYRGPANGLSSGTGRSSTGISTKLTASPPWKMRLSAFDGRVSS